MQIASLIAGYSLGEADMLRRAMGKKDKAKMAKEKSKFIDQGERAEIRPGQGVRAVRPDRVLRGLRVQQEPQRRLRHGGLRDRLPESQLPHRVHGGPALHQVRAHRRRGQVHAELPGTGHRCAGPGYQPSRALDFTITGDRQIRFGFAAVKGLGEAALEAILAARQAEGGFKDFFHVLKATDLQKANRQVWESLIKAGAFDSMEPNRAALLAGLPLGPGERRQERRGHRHDLACSTRPRWPAWPTTGRVPEDMEPWDRKERLRRRAGGPGPLRLRPSPGGVRGRHPGAHPWHPGQHQGRCHFRPAGTGTR